MKIALYKNVKYDYEIASGDGLDGQPDYVRLSEWVDVEFTPLSDEAIVQQQLTALDQTEQELREQFQRHLDGINQQRANLRALTYVEEK